jgi:hypothetical protein
MVLMAIFSSLAIDDFHATLEGAADNEKSHRQWI